MRNRPITIVGMSGHCELGETEEHKDDSMQTSTGLWLVVSSGALVNKLLVLSAKLNRGCLREQECKCTQHSHNHRHILIKNCRGKKKLFFFFSMLLFNQMVLIKYIVHNFRFLHELLYSKCMLLLRCIPKHASIHIWIEEIFKKYSVFLLY